MFRDALYLWSVLTTGILGCCAIAGLNRSGAFAVETPIKSKHNIPITHSPWHSITVYFAPSVFVPYGPSQPSGSFLQGPPLWQIDCLLQKRINRKQQEDNDST